MGSNMALMQTGVHATQPQRQRKTVNTREKKKKKRRFDVTHPDFTANGRREERNQIRLSVLSSRKEKDVCLINKPSFKIRASKSAK